jgi:hypothetical protein
MKPLDFHSAEPAYPACRIYCNQCKRRIRPPAMMCFCSTEYASGVQVVFCTQCAGVADVQPTLFS